MNKKAKRILLGLVLPTIVIFLICGVFFFTNAGDDLRKAMERTEKEKAEENQESVVKITKENWQEYFAVEMKEELEYNSDDELIRVIYSSVVSLKEEYRDKIDYSEEKQSNVILNGLLPTEHMIYKITDAKNSEWEIVKESHEMKPKGSSIDFTTRWNMMDENDFSFEHQFESYSKGKKLYVEIPREFEVEAVAGTLYFK